ncbi:MAG TPA: serine protease, partial [Longimicrobium sp.]|nr:serine protease [Longimicrobium sp.]
AEKQGRPDDVPPSPDELDHALLRLDRAFGAEPADPGNAQGEPRGWVAVPSAAPAIAPGMPIFILQHPLAQPLKLAIDTQGVQVVNPGGTRVRYATNTESGSSGSPCFDANWGLVALHHYGDPAFQHPATYNQGIPIGAIRERLRRVGKEGVLGGVSP